MMLIRNKSDIPLEIIRQIVSEIDNDPHYWYGIKKVKNLTTDGNTIVREAVSHFETLDAKK
ncbi:MAG: hypothetical protein AB7U98_13055 [Candidatus Nitrosocosmicus sp.]|jgi:hypothetical protein|nr:hypothetical protein [Candidatus Nitrosocosmicus sp.]